MQQQISHIEMMRRQYRYNRLQVLWLTGLSQSAYAQIVFDYGVAWMERSLSVNKAECRRLMSQPLIWNWWTHQWQRREELYVLPRLYELPQELRLEVFKVMHYEACVVESPLALSLVRSYQSARAVFNNKVKVGV